ncbi:MAG: hypothetical protein RBU28_00780 [Bacteroidales bacterium]|jgi:hypothetical protein|nr:hypothetical protein [Bacteroidales bacterium]
METLSEETGTGIPDGIIRNLKATWKWTMFLSVLGFIILGSLVLMSLLTTTFLTLFKPEESPFGLPELILLAASATVVLSGFLSVLFLFRFSRRTRNYIQNVRPGELTKAFRDLRLFFASVGITALLIISTYLFALALAGSSLSFLSGN